MSSDNRHNRHEGEQLMSDVEPLDPDEHVEIPDLTEEEWQTFVAALEQ